MQQGDLSGGRSREERQIAGLDSLELPIASRRPLARRVWRSAWPQLSAVGLVLVVWQLVVLAHLKPEYILPGPLTVLPRLYEGIFSGDLLVAVATTMQRAALGFALALVIGSAIGLAIVRWKLLRAAVSSLITGLQTMPSIAWFPLAILIFGLTEQTILFVIVLGAAPSVANGVIHGVDRAGRVLGARGVNRYRFVVFPAALPSFVAGMKQAWAFAWRSLMAGELLVIIAQKPSLGARLQLQRDLSDAEGLMATMLVVLAIGIVVDLVVFGTLDRTIRRRRGLA
jgi:sulfonate transport system permease protein